MFRDTEAALAPLPLQLRGPIDANLRKAKSVVHGGRAEFERGMAQGAAAARVAATTTVVARFVAAGGFIDEALLKAEREVTDREPRVGLIIKNPRVANEMREAAGQRSTILSRFAGTGIQLDDDARDKVSELTGAVHLAWDRLRRLSRQPGNAPKLDDAIAAIEFDLHGTGRTHIRRDGSGRPSRQQAADGPVGVA